MTMTVVVALVLVMVPSDVWAQTWTRSAEVSFVSMSGNTETRTIGVAGELEHTGRRWESLAQVDYRESATDDVLSARAFSADVRRSTQIADASPIGEYLETYVLVGYTTDHVRRHRRPRGAGMGPGVDSWPNLGACRRTVSCRWWHS